MPDCGALYLRELTSVDTFIGLSCQLFANDFGQKEAFEVRVPRGQFLQQSTENVSGRSPSILKGLCSGYRRQGMVVRDDTIEGNFL